MNNNNNIECYFIDTIRNDYKNETYYYVIHQYPDGHREAVRTSFTNYKDAEILKEELDKNLAATFYKKWINDGIEGEFISKDEH